MLSWERTRNARARGRRISFLATLIVFAQLFIIVPSSASVQPEVPTAPMLHWWQILLQDFFYHFGAFFIAIVAVILGYVELRNIRIVQKEKNEEDRRRFEAEMEERKMRLDLDAKRFEAEQKDREQLARIRDQEYRRLSQPAVELAKHVARLLGNDAHWAQSAMEAAKLLPFSSTVFGERSQHFQLEKQELAHRFSPYILKRCETLTANGNHVFLFIDAGSTLYPFFDIIGREAVKLCQRGEKWLERLHLVTNNLPGVEQIMRAGKRTPGDRYSKLAIEHCHILPGVPVP
jgi:hypothetical protein